MSAPKRSRKAKRVEADYTESDIEKALAADLAGWQKDCKANVSILLNYFIKIAKGDHRPKGPILDTP